MRKKSINGVNGFLMMVSPSEPCVSTGKDTTLKLDGPGFEFGLFNYVYMNNLLNSMSLIFINY